MYASLLLLLATPATVAKEHILSSYSTSRKSLNKGMSGSRDSFASRCIRTFNFLCANARTQTHVCRPRRRCTQNSSATFHVEAVIYLGLESLSRQSLSHVGSSSRSSNTFGARSSNVEVPPTNYSDQN